MNRLRNLTEELNNFLSSEIKRLEEIEKKQLARLERLDRKEGLIEAREKRIRDTAEKLDKMATNLAKEIDCGEYTDTERQYGKWEGIRESAEFIRSKWWND